MYWFDMKRLFLLPLCLLLVLPAFAQKSVSVDEVNALYPDIEKVYLDLHQNPELSFHETRTSQKLADNLRAMGFEVTTGLGGTGVVGVLRNGPGPVVMVRTELDALPVEEHTGLPYASTVKTKNDAGVEVSVMHACGHDLHMSSWLGTARLMLARKSSWKGTLIMLAQPAEELGDGALRVLKDGLYTRFPKPDFVIALHDSSDYPAGVVTFAPGVTSSNADSIDLTIYGRGGHGAKPNATIDPIVIAARVVMSLQTLVSRENDPWQPAVVTVGSIHGGTRYNIIPDEVHLQLTVRNFDAQVREHLIEGIKRIARAEAEAAGADKMPKFEIAETVRSVVNDGKVAERVVAALRARLGEQNVREQKPMTGSEDFSEYARDGVPTMFFFVGAQNPQVFEEAKKTGKPLPSLHSSGFAPDREPTLKTAITAETTAALSLLGN
jgi:hippurate hydrolase